MSENNHNLFQLKLFWILNGIIIITAATLTTTLLINENYSLNFTAEGYRTFLKEFQLPLGVLALIIPTSALIAAYHRSDQTKRQIDLMMASNSFSNHYKHYEEFCKYIAEFKDELAFSNKYETYNLIFTHSKQGILNHHHFPFTKLENEIKKFLLFLVSRQELKIKDIIVKYKSTYYNLYNITKISHNFDFDNFRTIEFEYNDKKYSYLCPQHVSSIFYELKLYMTHIIKVLKFENYQANKLATTLFFTKLIIKSDTQDEINSSSVESKYQISIETITEIKDHFVQKTF
ncbi:hypothetical protein [Salidesulfovibrio onnuriiensis]|uniref:hypothetical protein n=1 Tax=Salidesulfovibrio onnuriiensis TaxID=2583823 RepID=UPI0011C86BFF|nr:hypothetical protein [Salidesulfovibrio onnuriiensis]